MKVVCLNSIAKEGLELFSDRYEFTDRFEEAEIALVRSASLHELALPEGMAAIARAGAGVNNIPLDLCTEKGVVVFNAPGANANAVKELVVAGMLLAARDIFGGFSWLQENKEEPDVAKRVEGVKKQFAGGEIMGKTLGVLGLGAVGIATANCGAALGMNVAAYTRHFDKAKKDSLAESVLYVNNMADVLKRSDYVTLHMALKNETRGLINAGAIDMMKDGAVLLNFARDTLVNDDDLAAALHSGKISRYITDFPNDKVMKMENVIAVPHLGASTREAEDNCAIMAVKQLRDYIENGNITNSVNFPACSLGVKTGGRTAILYREGAFDVIAAMGDRRAVNAAKNGFGYCLIESPDRDQVADAARGAAGVLRVRTL